jgi:hypothetical protein
MDGANMKTVGKYVGSQGVWTFTWPADGIHEILLFFCACGTVEEPGTLQCEGVSSQKKSLFPENVLL